VEDFEREVVVSIPHTAKVLQAAHPQHRTAFSQWLLQQNAADSNFISQVLVMDEAYFRRTGILNSLTCTHVLINIAFNSGSTLPALVYNYIWAGINGDLLTGPNELYSLGSPIYNFKEIITSTTGGYGAGVALSV
jgi:hypothetical protein